MIRPFETVTDLWGEADVLRRRRYGVIEVCDERFSRVRLRPLPKVISLFEPLLLGAHQHRRRGGNHCWLYYNQPRRCSNFLALRYIVSSADCTMRTARGALTVLDEIARLKGIDAIVCDVANWRISDRLLARWGWEPNIDSRWHRHYIKRFYGNYRPCDEALALCHGYSDEAASSGAENVENCPCNTVSPSLPSRPVVPVPPAREPNYSWVQED